MTKLQRAGRILLAVVVVAGAAAGAGFLWLRTSLPRHDRDVTLPGLADTVVVLRDSLGIPHLRARSVEDLYFAQGYAHATDRLWQMEMFRRVAWGRLSELFGETTLEADRFLRTLGMGRAAEGTLASTDPELLRLLEAYAAGVNAALESRRGALPPEFVVLRTEPEPWKPVHTLAVEKIMAWDLSEYGVSLAMAGAREELDAAELEVVRPGYPAWGPTILGDSARETASRLPAARRPAPSPGVSPRLLDVARVPPVAAALLGSLSTVRASNAWVVGPGRSRSGRPLLANDMHLGLEAPNIWYLVALRAPGMAVAGMSLPGAPGVVAGHNRAVAWGFTNAYVDDVDFFIERVDPADTTRYRTPEGTEPFRRRVEEIRVRGREDPERLVVRETRHGPIMTPVDSRAGEDLLAARWVGHGPAETFRAVLAMNRARTAAELEEALRWFTDPHQNVIFADTAGSFGYRMAGRVPLRRSGRPPLLPVPGWTGEHDWVGYLPFDEHPAVRDPPSGYVVTANNRQSRDSVSTLINSRWAPPFRAMRIRELVESAPVHDAGSFRRMQLDVLSLFARRYRDRAVAGFREAGLPGPAGVVESWDLRADTASAAATLFFSWVQALETRGRRHLYDDGSGYFPRKAVRWLMEERPEGYDSLAAEAAVDAGEAAGGLRWGEAHRLVLGHPLARAPVVGPLLGFRLGPFPREGAHHTVNPASFGGARLPFTSTSGPSQRHVVDLADVDGSGGFITPGGSSGIPFSPHYDDQLPRWRSGELWRVPLDPEAAEARALHRALLLPGGR